MKFKKILESVNPSDLDGRYFYVNEPTNPAEKYVVVLTSDGGNVFAQFLKNGDKKPSRTRGGFEEWIVDYSKSKLEDESYKVTLKNSWFEFRDRYGNKFEGEFDDEILDIRKVSFRRSIVKEPLNF